MISIIKKIKDIMFKEKKRIYSCIIYKTKKEYKIVTQSESNTGLFIGDKPIYILPINVNLINLKDKIFESLNSSKVNVKMPNSYEAMDKWQKDGLNDLQEKSWSSLYKKSNSCEININLEKQIIIISPLTLKKGERGLYDVTEDILELEYNDNELEITEKIIEVLNKSYH